LAFFYTKWIIIIINNLGLIFLKRLHETLPSPYEILDGHLDSRIQQVCSFKITDRNNQPGMKAIDLQLLMEMGETGSQSVLRAGRYLPVSVGRPPGREVQILNNPV
jgi:hypothetical protein